MSTTFIILLLLIAAVLVAFVFMAKKSRHATAPGLLNDRLTEGASSTKPKPISRPFTSQHSLDFPTTSNFAMTLIRISSMFAPRRERAEVIWVPIESALKNCARV